MISVRKVMRCMNLLDHTEQVDVGIVHSEVDKHGPCASVYPQVLHERVDDGQGISLVEGQVLNIATTFVVGHLTPVSGAIQIFFRLIVPPK